MVCYWWEEKLAVLLHDALSRALPPGGPDGLAVIGGVSRQKDAALHAHRLQHSTCVFGIWTLAHASPRNRPTDASQRSDYPPPCGLHLTGVAARLHVAWACHLRLAHALVHCHRRHYHLSLGALDSLWWRHWNQPRPPTQQIPLPRMPNRFCGCIHA